MRLHRVILRSGANADIEANVLFDDPASDSLFFYLDEAQQHLVATLNRDQVAGIIFHPKKSGVSNATTPLSRL